jgi:hypothetical protein
VSHDADITVAFDWCLTGHFRLIPYI